MFGNRKAHANLPEAAQPYRLLLYKHPRPISPLECALPRYHATVHSKELTRPAKPFRMRTYAKTGGRGPRPLPHSLRQFTAKETIQVPLVTGNIPVATIFCFQRLTNCPICKPFVFAMMQQYPGCTLSGILRRPQLTVCCRPDVRHSEVRTRRRLSRTLDLTSTKLWPMVMPPCDSSPRFIRTCCVPAVSSLNRKGGLQ